MHGRAYFRSLKITSSILMLTLLCGFHPNLLATKYRFPQGCREVNFKFRHDFLILDYHSKIKTVDQTIYFVHNYSYHPVTLQTASPQKYMPTYKKTIPSGSWAALAKNRAPLQLSCSRDEGTTSFQIKCNQTVELCNYNNAKFPPHNLGTYWLERTGDLTFIKHYAIRKGILLRW